MPPNEGRRYAANGTDRTVPWLEIPFECFAGGREDAADVVAIGRERFRLRGSKKIRTLEELDPEKSFGAFFERNLALRQKVLA